jgi:hypothetical protein
MGKIMHLFKISVDKPKGKCHIKGLSIWQDDVEMYLKCRYMHMSSALSRLRIKFNGGFCERGKEHRSHVNHLM